RLEAHAARAAERFSPGVHPHALGDRGGVRLRRSPGEIARGRSGPLARHRRLARRGDLLLLFDVHLVGVPVANEAWGRAVDPVRRGHQPASGDQPLPFVLLRRPLHVAGGALLHLRVHAALGILASHGAEGPAGAQNRRRRSPAGAPVTDDKVTKDALFRGRLTLWQPAKGAGYRANVDAILLAAFAGAGKVRAAVDLGAGAGAVGLTLLFLGAA